MKFFNSINTLQDVGINYFTPISFYNPGDKYPELAGAKKATTNDKIVIHFPFFMKRENNILEIPYINK